MDLSDSFHPSSVVPLLIAVGASWAWFRWERRLRAADRRRSLRTTVWVAAATLFLVAMVGPLDWLGERRLMAAHMVQHLLLFSAVPGLIVFAWPVIGARVRLSATGAAGCLMAGAGTIWLLHLPLVLEPGLSSTWLHEAQHLLLVAAGVLVVLPLTAAGSSLGFGAAVYLVAAELSIGALGVWLAWSPDLIYSVYVDAPRTWGLSVETDQALAGALLLVVEEPFLAIEFAAVFIAALGSQDADGG